MTPHDAAILFKDTDSVLEQCEHMYLVTVGHQRDSGETKPKLSRIKESLVVKIICWVLVWYEQLRNVTFV